MIDMARLVCKDDKFKLMIESDGKRHEFDLTKTRALYLMESGIEAMRESDKRESLRRDLLGYFINWCGSLPIKHPQQAQRLEEAKKIFDHQ